jgi:hypothetical protein
MENTHWILIIVTILLLVAFGYFGYRGLIDANDKNLNDAFSLGYNKSLVDVAQGQSQTGTLIFWINNSIKVVSVETLCKGLK